MTLHFLNNSFYGIPLGIYAMIGVTTGVLAIMTINDSSQSSSSTPTFELPNILSSESGPEEKENPPAAEEPAPVEEETPVEEENKFTGGKKIDGGKKKRKTRRNKSKSTPDSKKTNKKTKRK
jgi:hypothetical protein